MRYYVSNTLTPNTNPRTLLQIAAPTNQRVRIIAAEIGMAGSTPATPPVLFDWCIQNTAGTASAATVQYQDRGIDETKLATVLKDFTTEPTLVATLIVFPVHQQGTYPWRPPWPIIVKGAERVGFRYRSGNFVPVTFTVYVEE